jgi:hypothetical protein
VNTAELFLRNARNGGPVAYFEDRSYSYRELVAESLRRAALWGELRDASKPPHIGVLRNEAWRDPGTYWRPTRGERLRPLAPRDLESLAHLLR